MESARGKQVLGGPIWGFGVQKNCIFWVENRTDVTQSGRTVLGNLVILGARFLFFLGVLDLFWIRDWAGLMNHNQPDSLRNIM